MYGVKMCTGQECLIFDWYNDVFRCMDKSSMIILKAGNGRLSARPTI